jgi:hypothetical protein
VTNSAKLSGLNSSRTIGALLAAQIRAGDQKAEGSTARFRKGLA